MRKRGMLSAWAALAILCLSQPAAAQKLGSLEIGAFGRYTIFDNAVSLKNAIGGGGQLGIYLMPRLSLEVSGAYVPTKDKPTEALSVKHIPVFARLLANVPVSEKFSLLVGAGYLRSFYALGDASAPGDNKNGAHGLIGFRAWLNDAVSIRAEGILQYTPTQWHVDPAQKTYAAQIGVSYVLGRAGKDTDADGVPDGKDACAATPAGVTVDAAGCPVDTDKDHVADYQDRCPNTPAGAQVDANGCPTDADKDGVFDGLDKCPNTPVGAQVDASGCPTDADKDGVFDGLDKCANTPTGTPVDATGCPRDSDNDGVNDAADRCPNTPAGAQVDGAGCPTDADKDGVFDGLDKCPNTPAGRQVDANGCPVLFEENKPLILQGVTFATGRAELTGNSRTVLDLVAQSLIGWPDLKVEVAGFTDNTGSSAVNQRLSQARADAVRTYLISKGVPAARLTAKGYGPAQPIADNRTTAGREKNRRVELRKTS
jgi:outer membrane protein OmpA-like peptidoglycan-associated protein